MEGLINVVIGILSVGIVQGLKALKMPTKVAPVVCLIIASILVALAKVAGIDMDVNSVTQGLLTALGISGVSVLAYDQIKGLLPK